MKMNRRNVLVGLGGIVASGGALLGTGAFSQVSADRSVSVDVADDSDALVGIEAGSNTDLVTESDGTVEIDLSQSRFNNESSMNATGLNRDATTVINGGLVITNNYNSDIEVWFENNWTGSENIDLKFFQGDTEITSSDPLGVSYQEEVDIRITTTGAGTDDNIDGNVKVKAEPA